MIISSANLRGLPAPAVAWVGAGVSPVRQTDAGVAHAAGSGRLSSSSHADVGRL